MTDTDSGYDGARHAGAVLTIDLNAIVANWRLLAGRAAGAECSAVVKADGYGLGAGPVARALHAAGCRSFFVAQLEEGMRLAPLVPGVEIFILNGPLPGSEALFPAAGLVPVLNSLGQIAAWQALARRSDRLLRAALHIDTGMARLGLPPEELDRLVAEPERLEGIDLALVMSHLVHAEDRDDPRSRQQLDLFDSARARLPAARASMANSSGIFLGPDFHLDMVRPGAALYGTAPVPGEANPMGHVVVLEGKILQVRHVDRPQTVGYGPAHRVTRPGRIATVAVGYADGYLRYLGNRGSCFLGGIRVPVVGRVSMDLITLDVTEAPEAAAVPGAAVEILGAHVTVDEAAAAAETIGYEILTSLGRRYHRQYSGGA